MKWPALAALLFCLPASAIEYVALQTPPGYDFPEVHDPIRMGPTRLIRIKESGDVEVLIDPGPTGAIDSPSLSLDGAAVWYARCQLGRLNGVKTMAESCQLERLTLATGAIETFTLPGPYNMHPMECLPDKIVYVTHEQGIRPTQTFTDPNLQLAVLDVEHDVHEIIGYLSIGSALHPTCLRDGKIAYSSYESQGYRDRRLWAIWAIDIDGTGWMPLVSAFSSTDAWHWMTQLSTGEILVGNYYNSNNQGLGAILGIPPPDTATIDRPVFQNANALDTTKASIPWGCGWQPGSADGTIIDQWHDTVRFSFQPYGMRSLAYYQSSADNPGCGQGKMGHPSALPDGGAVVTMSAAGLRNGDLGIYRWPMHQTTEDGDLEIKPVEHYSEMITVLDSADNDWYARAIVSYAELHGIAHPPERVEQDSNLVAPGEPFGYLGTSSTCHEAVQPGGNSRRHPENWVTQGSAVQPYPCADIVGMRFIEMKANPVGLTPSDGFLQWPNDRRGAKNMNERFAIFGEVPIEADGSWAVRVPANTPLCFQPITESGRAVAGCATWKQVRPHEARTDCGGCHAHDKLPIPFQGTLAWTKMQQGAGSLPDVAMHTPMLEDIGPVVRTERSVTLTYEDLEIDIPWADTIELADFLDIPRLIAAVNDPAKNRSLYRYASLGMPLDKGTWYTDDQPPVVSADFVGGSLYIGAYDVEDVAPVVSAAIEGEGVELTQVGPVTWKAPFGGGVVRITATDASGNVGELDKWFAAAEPVPIPIPDDPNCQIVDVITEPPGCAVTP